MPKSKFFKQKSQSSTYQKEKSHIQKVSIFVPFAGAATGAMISPLLKKYYNVEFFPLPYGIGRSPVLIPAVLGGSALIGGLFTKDENLRLFLLPFAGAAIVTAALEVILNQMNLRSQRMPIRQMPQYRPTPPIARPMVSQGNGNGRVISMYTPRSNKSASETQTKISSQIIYS